MSDDYFFGYGSLVNIQTHENRPAYRAVAHGWRRAWVATAERQLAYLTAVPDPDARIEGLIAAVPAAGWAALDAREAAYARLSATERVTHEAPQVRSVVIYEIAAANRLPPSDAHPVLLSYLDVVVQGYLAIFGQSGAARFFETTTGWEAPILDDRQAPRYPRAQQLSAAETAFVDARLAEIGAQIRPVE